MKYGTKAAARRAFIRDHGRAALAKLDRGRPGHGGPLSTAEGVCMTHIPYRAAFYALERLCPGGPWVRL